MTRIGCSQCFALIAVLAYASIIHAGTFAEALTLSEAEHIAISTAPELKQLQANANSLEQQSIADGQFSDPQLMLSAANVPTNSYSFNQDDMTMIQMGLQQSFPRGHSLSVKSKQTKALAKAEQKKSQEQAAVILRSVRESWLDLYYWTHAENVIRENRTLYRRLLKVTESQYSTGKVNQSDVLQLRVELSRLNDQEAQVQQRIDIMRAQLGRLIGAQESNRSLSKALPSWPNPASFAALQVKLQNHPVLKIDAANIEAARDEVDLAKEQFKPGWVVDVGYAIRHGNFADGQSRSNFFGAQITVDLPIFPGNRQDKRLGASADQLVSTELNRDIHYRDLLKELTSQYAIWTSLVKRENLYMKQLTPEARQNSKAALLAYQNATTDLTTVLRAYSNQLTIRLEKLQVEVERSKARAGLLYLEGVTL